MSDINIQQLLDKEVAKRNCEGEVCEERLDQIMVAHKYKDSTISLICAFFAYGNLLKSAKSAKSAKSEAVLMDNYIDDTVFILFSKYPSLKIKIYAGSILKQLHLDFQKYSSQYKNIELQEFSHL